MKKLGLDIPDYETSLDPTRNSDVNSKEMDWTIPTTWVKEMKILYKKVCTPVKRKKKATFMYERDISTYPQKIPKRKKEKKEEVCIKKEEVNDTGDDDKSQINELIKDNDDKKEIDLSIKKESSESNVT